MNGLMQDVHYALRQMRKSPGFAAAAILTLALGIGANTAIFTMLNAVLLKAVPVPDPGHLVVFKWSALKKPMGGYSSFGDCGGEAGHANPSGCSFSLPMFQEIRSKANVFSGVAAFAGPASLNLTGNGAASIAGAELVTGEYFKTLGVGTVRGRPLELSDDMPGAEPVVVLSYAYWASAFAGDAAAVGKTIWLNQVPFVIAGIAEPGFTRLTPGKTQDMWLPLSFGQRLGLPWDRPTIGNPGEADPSARWWLTMVGRLRPDTSSEQAEAAVNLLFRNAMLYEPKPLFKEADNPAISLLPAQDALVGIRGRLAEPLYILMCLVGVVLGIACANVAGLILARATAREREMAVRFALGAGRKRIVRQLLTESILLSAIGAILGAIIAFWGAHALTAFLSTNSFSTWELDVHPDARVLVFTIGVAMLAGIALGIVPAFRSTGVNLVPALKASSGEGSAASGVWKGRFRLGDSLVVGQVALSVLVLAVAGLLVRSLFKLENIDPGFDTHRILLFGIDPTAEGMKDPQIRSLYQDVQGRLAAIPGVASVGYSSDPLLNGSSWTGDVRLEGQGDKSVGSQLLAVGPGFFETLRVPLLTGRTFTQPDMGSAQPVVIINQAFAQQFFAGGNPIGLHVGRKVGDKLVEREIVGVVANTKYDQLRTAEKPITYLPLEGGQAHFELRTASDPTVLIPAVRQVVGSLDQNLPLFDVRTQSEAVDRLLFNERLVARLSGLFAAFALILVCVGVYGLLSYDVSRRTREIGIRSALGADPFDVLLLVVRQGIVLAMIGVAFGIAAAFGVTRYLRSTLYGVRPNDPVTLLFISILLIAVALLACYIPARRAAKVDPMVALRYE